ncbi:MAG: DUF3592 domain-containing protein [Thermoguttaceae bacterium]
MARTFRYFEKKRRHRRTTSRTLAVVGEALFFTVFLVGGIGGLFLLYLTVVVPQWQANTEFVSHRCTVLDKRIGEKADDEETLYRPEIQVEYSIDDEKFVVWAYDIWAFDSTGGYSPGKGEKLKILEGFQEGQVYPCWYDPGDPSRVVLVRSYRWWLLLLFILPVSFILIGSARLIYLLLLVGKSAEHRSAFAQKAANLATFDAPGRSLAEYPAIPADSNLTDSPGTTLAFRLPVSSRPGWIMAVATTVSLVWNGIVAWLLIVAIGGHLHGHHDWLLTLFALAFAAAGIVLIVYSIRHAMVTTGIGPTLLEVSEQPLRPGRDYRLFVSQTGRLRLRQFEVSLVCEEEATFRHGTDTRKESCRVSEQSIFERDDFEVIRGVPFEVTCDVRMPENAMHSFKSAHNEVNWRFVVRGKVAGWPDFERSFPILVYPGNNGNGET